jgi:hypothetical protein
VLAVAQSPVLIAAQQAREGVGTGIVEAVYQNSKVRTLPAAFQIGNSLLSHYGQDLTVLQFDTTTAGLVPGQLLTVNLSDFGLSNQSMLVAAVSLSDQNDGFNLWYHVAAVASVLESAQWQTYWQNLMRQSSDPSDLSDVSDTSLALLLSSTVTRTPSATVTKTTTVCPLVGALTVPFTIC